jgi:hypothetical protein
VSIAARICLKLLWLKKTWTFRWAHKPLCSAYRMDVLRIRNVFVCRSCLCVYSGMLLSLTALAFFPAICAEYCGGILAFLLSFTLPLSHPTLYRRLPRPLRDACRLSLGFAAVQIPVAAGSGHAILALAAVLLCVALWKVYYRQRATRKIQFCHACREYSPDSACSGYSRQLSLLREYEQEATEYLLSTGYTPAILKPKP